MTPRTKMLAALAGFSLIATRAAAQTINLAEPVALATPIAIATAPAPTVEVDAATSQLEPRYKLNLKVDIPLTAVSTAWTLYAFGRIYDKPHSSEAEIAALNKDNLSKLDRWAAGMHDESAAKNSDYIFYGAIPVPFLLLADRKIRRDAPKVGFMYLEAMAVTGLLYTGTNFLVNRYRPETYRTDKPVSERTDGNYKNSFFAGHVAQVGTATFFMAKIYNDYHPHNNFKYVMWGGAILATGTTAYLRHKAGKHFPTDIAVGLAVGILDGVLIPELHKNRKFDGAGFSLSPAMIQEKPGFALTYRFR